MYDQAYIDNLPHMTVKEATALRKAGRAKIGLKHFHAEHGCGKCGCYIKVVSEALNRIFCANCAKSFKGLDLTLPTKERKVAGKETPVMSQDPSKGFSVASIKFQQSFHNRNVNNTKKDMWRLPTVISANIK